VLQQKKMFKVLAMTPKKGGGTLWTRVGTGFTNQDQSVNIYLEAMPKNFELQLREMEEEDLRKREPGEARGFIPPSASAASAGTPF
jgi:hypothetical protein